LQIAHFVAKSVGILPLRASDPVVLIPQNQLDKPEDIVDKQQYVLLGHIPKYSAIVKAASPTRILAPGGSFIWP